MPLTDGLWLCGYAVLFEQGNDVELAQGTVTCWERAGPEAFSGVKCDIMSLLRPCSVMLLWRHHGLGPGRLQAERAWHCFACAGYHLPEP